MTHWYWLTDDCNPAEKTWAWASTSGVASGAGVHTFPSGKGVVVDEDMIAVFDGGYGYGDGFGTQVPAEVLPRG